MAIPTNNGQEDRWLEFRTMYCDSQPMFRTTEEPIDRIIQRISYKPGVTIHRSDHTLHISMSVPEKDNPEKISTITGRYLIPDILRYDDMYRGDYEQRVCHFVREKIREFEHHEIDEWFKYAGVRTHDPHRR